MTRTARSAVAPGRARVYFAAQAAAGALWWITVFASDDVRRWTLGDWDPALLVVPDVLLFVGASAVTAATGNRWSALVVTLWTSIVTAALVVTAFVDREAGWGAAAMVLAIAGSLAAALTLWLGHLPVRWFFVGPFSFRVTNDESTGRHVRRSLSQLVVFWSSFLILLPIVLSWIETRWRIGWSALDDDVFMWTGAAVFVLASAFGVWSCLAMAVRGQGTPLPAATARKLVVVGPYRCVRNPMAVAGMFQTIGVGLWLGSWVVLASAAAGAVLWHTIIRPEEEADLTTRFGDDYERYRTSVRCWIPTFR